MTAQVQDVSILLVDDDSLDRMAFRRALQAQKIANPIYEAKDGIEGLEMLRGTVDRDPVPHPLVVVLDLNMPRMNGHEFLTELRADEDLRRAVVFVLTTSTAPRDRQEAYGRNVAGYIVKSDVGQSFLEAISMLDNYWRIVILP